MPILCRNDSEIPLRTCNFRVVTPSSGDAKLFAQSNFQYGVYSDRRSQQCDIRLVYTIIRPFIDQYLVSIIRVEICKLGSRSQNDLYQVISMQAVY